MSTLSITPWNLMTASGALLAFLVGLYTLVGRERKSPYLINTVFSIFGICIAGVIIDLLSLLTPPKYQSQLLWLGSFFLLSAIAITFWRLNILHVRFFAYVNSSHPKYWATYRSIKGLLRRFSRYTPYEFNASPIPANFSQTLTKVFEDGAKNYGVFDSHTDLSYRSAAIRLKHQGQANEILANLALAFLKSGYSVQYLTASRHPIEFIEFLKDKAKNTELDWVQASKSIVVIDAYTPHFGFIDSIYSKATESLTRIYGVLHTPSSQSYAGLHTAASVAFNKLKKQSGGSIRNPTLLIYEDTFALADLESPEQYRVFVRHVLPSERLWDGMFTVFAEAAQPNSEWKLLSSYASATLDFDSSK